MKIRNVAIFGGNGTIGSLMCGLIAGLGNANVYLISRDKKKLDEKLLDKIYTSIKSDCIDKQIILCDYQDAKKILKYCDWIFESVAEEYGIKQAVYQVINEYAKKEAIITTGTSGLSIHKLSESFSEERKSHFFGTHFFNPPYHMSLCEIVITEYTNYQEVVQMKQYLEQVLLRTTVISKDNSAFIANRIGFKLMNDLLLLAEQYREKGGIDYIDSFFTGYTGRSMQPLETIDFVGLDIHKAIVDNIKSQTQDEFQNSFILPKWFERHIKRGSLGNKVGKGLYKKEENVKYVYDITSENYIPKRKYEWKEIIEIEKLIRNGEYVLAYKELLNGLSPEKQIVIKTLVEYIIYSLYIGKITAQKIEDCDDAMANGFGWCPPIALKELIDEAGSFKKLCSKYIDDTIMKKYEIDKMIDNLPKSKYDYRKYIKAI